MKTRITRLATVLVAAAVLGLSGCSGGSEAPATDSSGSDSPAVEATADDEKGAPGLPKGVQGATDIPDDVPNDPDVRDNVAVSSCESAAGGWRASGTATNPGKKPVTYTVTVFFTTNAATVIGTGRTKVQVAPGADETWHIDDAIKAPDSTLCVLRGVA